MVFTSNHKNFNNSPFRVLAISGNRGKDAGYTGKCYPKLAPKIGFWHTWHENIGKVTEDENNKYYITEYYKQVLAHLDPEEVYRDADDSVLLCYEDNQDFCHRHIVSAWLELFLGVDVNEVNNKFEVQERPLYIKKVLEDVIKANRNMNGFNCIRASYLFEKANKLDYEADILEGENGMVVLDFRQAAAYYRSEADMIEDKYNTKKTRIKSKKDDFKN